MAEKEVNNKSLPMHPGFYFFPEIVPFAPANLDWTQLEPVQIHEPLLTNALNRFLSFKKTGNHLQRFLNLSIDGDDLDFHLTFQLEAGTDKILPMAHFALRHEAHGHNAVLYWFYQLCAVPGTRKLYWVWDGCAGQGDANSFTKYRTPGVQYGTTVEAILKSLLQSLEGSSTRLELHAKSKKWNLF